MFQITPQRKVEFDFQVTYNDFGSIKVCGEIPRIKPRTERKYLTECDITFLKIKLETWVKNFFQIQTESLSELIETAVIFAAFVNPFHEINSEKMFLAVKMSFWIYYTDDFLEMEIRNGVPLEKLDKGMRKILSCLNDDKENLLEDELREEDVGFRTTFDMLTDLVFSLKKDNRQFKVNIKPFYISLKEAFEAMRWYAVARFEENISEETFKFWRRIVSFFVGTAQVIIFLEDLTLPTNISNAPSFRRLLDIVNSVGAFGNDLLGIDNELKRDKPDNWIVFKVFEKKIPLQEAVAQVCNFITSEIGDYICLRNSIMEEFSHDARLVKYIDVLESFMDGHNRMYEGCTRYKINGFVRLVD